MAKNDLRDKFHEITQLKYEQQAVYFLNGFWEEGFYRNNSD
jgi:hypothetical protein